VNYGLHVCCLVLVTTFNTFPFLCVRYLPTSTPHSVLRPMRIAPHNCFFNPLPTRLRLSASVMLTLDGVSFNIFAHGLYELDFLIFMNMFLNQHSSSSSMQEDRRGESN